LSGLVGPTSLWVSSVPPRLSQVSKTRLCRASDRLGPRQGVSAVMTALASLGCSGVHSCCGLGVCIGSRSTSVGLAWGSPAMSCRGDRTGPLLCCDPYWSRRFRAPPYWRSRSWALSPYWELGHVPRTAYWRPVFLFALPHAIEPLNERPGTGGVGWVDKL
jgi:hypothetical protein